MKNEATNAEMQNNADEVCDDFDDNGAPCHDSGSHSACSGSRGEQKSTATAVDATTTEDNGKKKEEATGSTNEESKQDKKKTGKKKWKKPPFALDKQLALVAMVAILTMSGQLQGVSGLLTTPPVNVLAKSGSEVRLRCSTDLTDPVYWLRRLHGASETQTLYYGSLGFSSLVNGRFKIDNSRGRGSYDVIIRNVTAKDAGVYVCQDDAGYGQRKEMQLVIFESFNCTMPMPPVGFVEPSDLAHDVIRASCSLRYHGNQEPRFQWRWSDSSTVDSTEESNDESKTIVSQVMALPRAELNGAKLTATATVSDDGSIDAHQDDSTVVQWTSPHQVTVLHASLQPGTVEQCKGSSLILVCNSECEYLEVQLNDDGLCQCVATYKKSGDWRAFTFSVYSCAAATSSSGNTLIYTIAIVVGVAAVMSAIAAAAAIAVIKRKRKRNKDHAEANGSPESNRKDTDSSASDSSGQSLIQKTEPDLFLGNATNA